MPVGTARLKLVREVAVCTRRGRPPCEGRPLLPFGAPGSLSRRQPRSRLASGPDGTCGRDGRGLVLLPLVSGVVAAFPVPAGAGRSVPHTVAAAAAFIALAAWPAVGGRRGPGLPWGLRSGVCAGASAVLFGLLGWFYVELVTGGLQLGLAERVAAGAQALWPLAVVITCYWRQSLARRPSASPAM